MSLIIKDSFMLFALLILLNFSSCKNMINEDVHPLDFYTQYNQFYIVDSGYIDSEKDIWADSALVNRLGLDENLLAVFTGSYGPIKGQLEIKKDGSNIGNLEEYDHVVEGRIDIETGVLQVQDCPTSNVVQEVELPSGLYSVRVYSKGLTTVEGDEGDDFYRIVIWPAKDSDKKVKVLKQYTP